MQNAEIKSLGFKLNKQVPDSVDEFDRLAKESGAALREANRNVLYRSTLAAFRNAFLHGLDAEGKEGEDGFVPAIDGLDKMTGIERKTKVTKPEVKDADGKVTQEQVEAWDETEDEYFSRVVAELTARGDFPSVEAAQASFQSHAQRVLDAIPFDPAKTERKSAGPKKTPKTYLDVAAEMVSALGSIEAAISRFEGKTGVKLTDRTEAGLAAAIWKDQTSQSKAKQLAAGYAA